MMNHETQPIAYVSFKGIATVKMSKLDHIAVAELDAKKDAARGNPCECL
jgi:hypothetical protein